MRKTLRTALLALLSLSAWYASGSVCYDLQGGNSELTISIIPDQDYDGTPGQSNFWVTGSVTIAWDQALGSGVVTGFTALSALPFSRNTPVLQGGLYYLTFGFVVPTTQNLTNGTALPVLAISLSSPEPAGTFEINPDPPLAQSQGDASFANTEGEQYLNTSNCILLALNVPLPAELLSFEAYKTGPSAAELYWEVGTEYQVDRYELQRSADARSWEYLGETPSFHYSYSKSYSYPDEAIPQSFFNQKTVYYRIKIIDLDGQFAFSQVRSVPLYDHTGEIKLYPNPAQAGNTIQIDYAQEYRIEEIRMVNNLGQAFTVSFQNGRLQIPEGLVPDLYLLQLTTANQDIRNIPLVIVP